LADDVALAITTTSEVLPRKPEGLEIMSDDGMS
jgi:hypothetical protein